MSDIERELEAELHRVLDPMASVPIPARRAVQSRGPVKTLLGGAGAALTIKVLTGVAVAAAAVTVAGAATTGSLNPSVWGQQVKQQVESCKDQLAQGQNGIGACVSQFANQHGQAVASAARQHGDGAGAAKNKDKNGNANGNGNAHATGNSNGSGDGNKSKPTDPHTGDPEVSDAPGHPPAKTSPGP
jgi:hypothetical protein